MRIVEEAEVRRRLTMPVCLDLMRRALKELEEGTASQPLRTIVKLPGGEPFGFMPASVQGGFGAKVLAAFPQNQGTPYPSHTGYVMMFEGEHGCFTGMADATSITELRTGAVSGVATDLLARKDAHTLAIIGAGAQGRSHLAAIREVREIREVRVYDLDQGRAETYCREMSEKYGISVTAAASAKEAVQGADIICTLTPSKEPYLEADWISPGAHINAVGAFTPTTREVTSTLVAKARLYADQVEAMKRECGEYLVPKSEGLLDEDHIVGSLGGVLLGQVPGRQGEEEITLFDALGLAVEDVMCAAWLCGEAE